MADRSQNKPKSLRDVAANKAREYRNDFKTSQSAVPLGILSAIFAAAGAVTGGIAFPILYATNFGVGLAMAFTGAACGAVAGFIIPQALNRIVSTTSFQYLKPSTYKEARASRAPTPKS